MPFPENKNHDPDSEPSPGIPFSKFVKESVIGLALMGGLGALAITAEDILERLHVPSAIKRKGERATPPPGSVLYALEIIAGKVMGTMGSTPSSPEAQAQGTIRDQLREMFSKTDGLDALRSKYSTRAAVRTALLLAHDKAKREVDLATYLDLLRLAYNDHPGLITEVLNKQKGPITRAAVELDRERKQVPVRQRRNERMYP